jgi:peptidoglycan/LPS O-acetylase OafA/YrhL
VGIAVLAAAGGVIASHVPEVWAGHELLLAIASAGVLSLLVSPATPSVGGVLAWPGNWSYSLYLIHMPMLRLIFTGEALLPTEWRQNGSFYWAGAVAVPLVPAAAWVWYRLFEKPFLPKPVPAPVPVLA